MDRARLRCTRSQALGKTFLVRVGKTAARTRGLFRPCPGRRIEKPSRLSSKASTEARSLWLMVRPQQTGPSATCLSQLPGQRIEVAIARSTSGQCVSFAFRSGGQSHELGAFSDESGEKSVAPVTVG